MARTKEHTVTNRKFWLTVGFDFAGFALASLALERGLVGAEIWLSVVNTLALLTAGYLGLNIGQKIGLAKVASPCPPEPEP